MPLNPKNTGQSSTTGFHHVLHKVFLDARRNMQLARMAEGTAEWVVQERTQARDKSYKSHSALFGRARKGDLSPTLFKELNDAETILRDLEAQLIEAEEKLEAAKQKISARTAAFSKAQANCVESGCPERHITKEEILDTSKEEEMARKAAKEQEERVYRQRYEAWKRRQQEEARREKTSTSPDDPEPSKEHQAKQSSGRSRQSGPSSKPRRKGPGPTDQPKSNTKSTPKGSPKSNPQSGPKSAPKSTPAKAATELQTYKEWLFAVEQAFKDYASLASFPSPPARTCVKSSCKSETRALTACACNIREGLQYLTVSQLNDLRRHFHPDRFSKCRADLVESFKKQASAVFVVVDAMYCEKR